MRFILIDFTCFCNLKFSATWMYDETQFICLNNCNTLFLYTKIRDGNFFLIFFFLFFSLFVSWFCFRALFCSLRKFHCESRWQIHFVLLLGRYHAICFLFLSMYWQVRVGNFYYFYVLEKYSDFQVSVRVSTGFCIHVRW
jgi:hypothetical protein